jgi:hypothetical protein
MLTSLIDREVQAYDRAWVVLAACVQCNQETCESVPDVFASSLAMRNADSDVYEMIMEVADQT